MPKWIQKAVEETRAGNCKRVIMLLPARTDTAAFQELVFRYATIVDFIKGRVHFGTRTMRSFPCCVVVFDYFMFDFRPQGYGCDYPELLFGARPL